MIGVKRSARDAVFARRDLRISDLVDFGVAQRPNVLVMLRQERPEDLAGRRELRGRELLVAERENVEFREVGVELPLHVLVERAGQIEAADLRARFVACQRRNLVMSHPVLHGGQKQLAQLGHHPQRRSPRATRSTLA